MFQRQIYEDSYTLDNYIYFMKKTNQSQFLSEDNMELETIQRSQSENSSKVDSAQIEKVEYYSKKQRKNSTQLSIFSWLVKDKQSQHSLFISLDKQLILKIYSYLRLSQIVTISQSCSYLLSCSKSLWSDNLFFEKFQTDKFTSQQLNKVMEKSKLDHIKQLKQIYQGKNIRKNRQKIKMRISDKMNGGMLQVFSISPKIKSGIVFIMDSHLDNILNSSYKGLKHIQLNRCAYLKHFTNISKCLELQKFIITYNENICTENLIPIFKRCLKLQSLEISQCRSVDETLFIQLKKIQLLESLTLKNFRQSFGGLHHLSYCQKLIELIIDDSLINDEQFMNGIRQLKQLKWLSIQGCALLTDLSGHFLREYVTKPACKLIDITISRVNISMDNIQQIKERLYRKNLQTLDTN